MQEDEERAAGGREGKPVRSRDLPGYQMNTREEVRARGKNWACVGS